MEIFLNSNPQSVDANCTVATLIKNLNLENKRLAVEVNLQIVPRSQFGNYTLTTGDSIEIVHAIGGG